MNEAVRSVDSLIGNWQYLGAALDRGDVELCQDRVEFASTQGDFATYIRRHLSGCAKSFLILNTSRNGLACLGFVCMGCGKWIGVETKNIKVPIYALQLNELVAKGFRMYQVWEEIPKGKRDISFDECFGRIKQLVVPGKK